MELARRLAAAFTQRTIQKCHQPKLLIIDEVGYLGLITLPCSLGHLQPI
jgi:DNA replication protein DnaC